MRYDGNGGLNFAWDLGVVFLGTPNLVIGGFSKKKFLNFVLKGDVEKCVGCFLAYLVLKVLFKKKKVLRDRKFKFLCEAYPPVRCNTHY